MKIAVLIDGGFLRVVTRKANRRYDPDFIERFAHACKADEEKTQRILYYDCPPFAGTVTLPVSGQEKTFESNNAWLNALSYKDLFAVLFSGKNRTRSRLRLGAMSSRTMVLSLNLNRRV